VDLEVGLREDEALSGDSLKPKLLLYQPRCLFFTMPLGPLAVASAVNRDRVQSIIIDGRLDADPVAVLEAHLDEAVCFGVSVLTGAPIEDALRVSREVKARRPELPVIWGGWHPSLFPLEVLAEAECVDVVVCGQGEATLRELIECYLDGWDAAGVAGIALRVDGEPRMTAARPLVPYGEFPAADYSLLPVERYFTRKNRRQLDYVTSVGCHYRCRFCADPAVFKRQRSAIPLDRVVAELSELAGRFGVEDVNFQDETFFSNRPWTVELATRLIACGSPFSWAATMRADQGARLTDHDFALLARSGLRKLLIGVEAGSSRMLERLGKDITLNQIETVARYSQKYDIAATYPFIFGIPGEQPADVEASLRLARRLKSMNWRNTTPFFFFKPYPGSELSSDVVAEGYELPKTLDEWSRFDYVTTSSPWVSDADVQRVRMAGFFSQLGWSRPRWWAMPVQALARLRCRTGNFRLPVEKAVIERLQPPPPLA